MKLFFKRPLSLVLRTRAHILWKLSLYSIVGGVSVLLLAVGLLLWKYGHASVALLFASGVVAVVFWKRGISRLRERFFGPARVSQVAVLSEVIQKGGLPPNKPEVTYARRLVKGRFQKPEDLAFFIHLIYGIIKTIHKKVPKANSLPSRVRARLFNLLLPFAHDAILSYGFATEDENIWLAAKDGVILYCQNRRAVLTASALMGLLTYLIYFLFLLVLGAGLPLLPPTPGGLFRWGLVAIALFTLKLVFLNPYASASVILTFHREVRGEVIDPQWETRLELLSDKFKELKRRSVEEGELLAREILEGKKA